MHSHPRPHKHYCECGNYRTCTRPDCGVVGWECDDCEDEHNPQLRDDYADDERTLQWLSLAYRTHAQHPHDVNEEPECEYFQRCKQHYMSIPSV